MTPKLSIIIVNYHSEDVLEACLRSLHVATSTAFEIILVDNSAQGNARRILQASGWRAHYFPQAENVGYAAAVNLGIAHAAGENLCLLHPDTMLETHALDRLLAWVEQHPRTIAGPRERDVRGEIVTSVHPYVTRRQVWVERTFQRIGWPRSWHPWLVWLIPTYRYALFCRTASAPRAVPVLTSTCLVMARATWTMIGEFTVELYALGLEAEWFRRAQAAACTAWYVPEAEVLHDAGASHRQVTGWLVREAIDGDRRWHARRFGLIAVIVLGLMLWLEDRFRPPSTA